MSSREQPPTTRDLQELGIALGLAAVGVCAAQPYAGTERDIATRAEEGLFADLKFTMARPDVSCHPERLVPEARSVVSAALCYWRPEPANDERTSTRGILARYTRWDAYTALGERLEQIAEHLRSAGARARVLVDSNDHVDREAAVRSGVGFYGKNTNVITRLHGSWVVLGTVVTDAQLDETTPMRQGCGSCTRCIDACPTDAIVAPGVLDTGSCITYWTQSRHSIAEPVRTAMGARVYGCDICQDVCPWNTGVRKRQADLEPMEQGPRLLEWLESSEEDLDREYQRFFIPRRQVRYLRRNALVAFGNAGRAEDAPIVASWVDHPDEMLREHAVWALEQLRQRFPSPAVPS